MASPEGSRRRRRRIVVAAISAALAFVLVELAARGLLAVLGPPDAPIELGWEGPADDDTVVRRMYRWDEECFFVLRPDLVLPETPSPRLFDIRTNALGLRGAETERAKPAGAFRVLCVGDSCTFGTGAGTDETYPAHLERLLGAALEPTPVQVLNAGVPGFTSYQGRRWLESRGFDLDPDLVVFALGNNDSMPATPGPRRSYEEGLFVSDREYGLLHRKRARWGFAALARRLFPKGRAELLDEYDLEDASKLRVSIEEYRDNVLAVVDACRSRGVLVAVVGWPVRQQAASEPLVDRAATMVRYQELARALALREGVTYVELLPAVAGRGELYVDDVHLSGEGYAAIAGAMAAALAPLAAAR